MSSLILCRRQKCDASEGKQEEKEDYEHNTLSKCLILETELIEKLCQVVTYFMLTPFSFQSSEHDQQQLQKQIIYFEQSLNRVWWILKDFHLYPFPVVRKQLCYWTIKQALIAKVRDSHTANSTPPSNSACSGSSYWSSLWPSCTSSTFSALAQPATSHPQDSKTYQCQPHWEDSRRV